MVNDEAYIRFRILWKTVSWWVLISHQIYVIHIIMYVVLFLYFLVFFKHLRKQHDINSFSSLILTTYVFILIIFSICVVYFSSLHHNALRFNINSCLSYVDLECSSNEADISNTSTVLMSQFIISWDYLYHICAQFPFKMNISSISNNNNKYAYSPISNVLQWTF